MKNALIDPNTSPVKYISGWTDDTDPQPIYTQIDNSYRVAQVSDKTFDICPPLFWTPCADDVVTDEFYYHIDDKEIYPVPESPPKPIPTI